MRTSAYSWEGSAPCAALSARPIRHPNTGLVSPLWQGDACPGLTGVYAILNGIRLTLAHEHVFSAAELDRLLRVALRFLDARLTAQQCVANGLRVQLWRQLGQAMAETTHNSTGLRLTYERLHVEDRSTKAAISALESALARRRVPLILRRGGKYTVVSGMTPSSLLLFDSYDAYWISKRSCGVPGDGEGLRHAIYPSSFIAFSF